MTEEEAKKKMCGGPPAVAHAIRCHTEGKRDIPMWCAGSDCVAWAWSTERGRFWKDPRQGDCGLKGRVT